MQIRPNARNIAVFLVGVFFVYLIVVLCRTPVPLTHINVDLKDLYSYAVLAVEMGGHAVKRIYEENSLSIQKKGKTDVGKDELLTKADLISNQLMTGLLGRLAGLEVISEEKASASAAAEAERYHEDNYDLWARYKSVLGRLPTSKVELSRINVWIDPLDATQEYTEGLTEYVTVMACVTVDGAPVFGAIYRPFFNETIIGLKDWGVFSTTTDAKIDFNAGRPAPKKVVVSRSHAGAVQDLVRQALSSSYEVEPAGGSGYKTLRLINSTAEFYIHSTAIKKWDLCAGDAIIRAAGGALVDLTGREIDYRGDLPVVNKKGLLMSLRDVYSTFEKVKPFVHV